MLNSTALQVLAAVACGVLLPLSLAPFGWWPLAVLSAGGLFLLMERCGTRLALLGWASGVGKYGLGASWIYVSIHEHGHASVLLSVFLVALFVAGMALFPLTQFWLYGRLRSRTSFAGSNALIFVMLWVVWEWLLTWVLSGFPWLFAGSGQLTGPFAGYAPIGGVLLVSLSVVAVGCTLALVLQVSEATERPLRRRLWAGACGLLVLVAGLGLERVQWVTPAQSRSVALVQGNVDQASKWLPENRVPIVQRFEALSESHWGVDLLLWPEAAITVYEHQARPLLDRWQARGNAAGTTLVLGMPAVQVFPGTPGEYSFANLARAVGKGDGRYSKRRLVPFGEYVPLEDLLRGLIAFFDLPMSHAEPGAIQQPLLNLGDHRAGMAICYEIAYPGLINGDLPAADVLLTISNDAWFGASIGPHQHLQIARMRALENGRYLLRATNTGLTAIVDERGRVVDQLPQFQQGVLRGSYRLVSGETPFGRMGNALVFALVVLGMVVVVFLRAFRTPNQQKS